MRDLKRRSFLTTAAGALAGSSVFPTFAIGKAGKSANSKLNVAFIGSGGWIAQQPYQQGCSEENLVAFCDVDRNHCAENMNNWQTTQPFFDDFRVMFDKMHKEIDAVVISTPDHTHFANPAVMPPPSTPVPAGLDWDLWLGPAASREFSSEYHPLRWRSFYDFGLGMLGDWGCHTLDTPVWPNALTFLPNVYSA